MSLCHGLIVKELNNLRMPFLRAAKITNSVQAKRIP